MASFAKEIQKIKHEFELRKKRDNLTVSAVARAAGVDRITIYAVLNGGRVRDGRTYLPTLDSVLAVADVLDLRLRVGRKGRTA